MIKSSDSIDWTQLQYPDRQLVKEKENLMGLGKIIQQWNLHDRYSTEFKNGFNGLFSLGYDATDGQISWKDAVKAGWTFAKAIDVLS